MRNVKKTVDELRPIDDTFMQKLSEDRGVCEELLQVVLERPHLQIISNQPQKEIHNIDTRSVRVDALCEDVDGSQFSVEVQKANNDDNQKGFVIMVYVCMFFRLRNLQNLKNFQISI